MDGLATSTIAALFYANSSDFAFSDLVAQLGSALLHAPEGGLDIHTAYEDFVVFDTANRRICLAYSNLALDFPETVRRHGGQTCVIVSVGDRPDAADGERDHLVLCETLAERIESRQPAQGSVIVESDIAFSEEAFDMTIEDILTAYWTPDEAPEAAAPEIAAVDPVLPAALDDALFAPVSVYARAAQPLAAETPPPLRSLAWRSGRRSSVLSPIRPGDLSDRFAARFDREIARRNAARGASPQPSSKKHAHGFASFGVDRAAAPQPITPTHDNPASAAFARLRQQPTIDVEDHRLFPTPAEAHAQPLVHRAAINAMNVAMMAFALPVGAFLVTLALLGRESMVMSARVTAVTGAGLGIAQSDSIAAALSAFM